MCLPGEEGEGEGEEGEAVVQAVSRVAGPGSKAPLGPPPLHPAPPLHPEVRHNQSPNLLNNPAVRSLSKTSMAVDGGGAPTRPKKQRIRANQTRQTTATPTGTPTTKS